VRVTLATFAGLLCVVLAGCNGERSTNNVTVGPSTRSCGFQSFGKGWYLRATRSLTCGHARTTFVRYFSTRGCNGPAASTCSVGAYRCRYDYGDDVERVRCAVAGRVIAFRSVP
jgi:hypothetical protein